MMKKILSIFISLFFLSCGSPDNSVKDSPYKFSGQDQYELVTRIKFPKDFKVITNPPLGFDDFVRQTVIELNKNDCVKFYRTNKFVPVQDTISSPFDGSGYSDSLYRQIPDRRKFLHSYGRNNYTNWFYLLDTTTCRLYCLISYPDKKGYTK